MTIIKQIDEMNDNNVGSKRTMHLKHMRMFTLKLNGKTILNSRNVRIKFFYINMKVDNPKIAPG